MRGRFVLLVKQFQNMKVKYFIPYLLAGLVPILTMRYIATIGLQPENYERMRYVVAMDIERYMGLGLIWYLVLIFYQFVDNPGCELLYACGDKLRLFDLGAVYVHILILGAILQLGFGFMLPGLILQLGKLSVILLGYCCAMYGLMYLSGSTLTAAMLVLTYHLLFSFMQLSSDTWNIFNKPVVDISQLPPTNYTPFLAVCGVLLLVGIYRNLHYVK